MVTATPRLLEPAVFGFALHSSVELRFFRHGGGKETLEIVEAHEPEGTPRGELLGEWPLQGASYPAHARLFVVPGGYEYFTSDSGLYRIDVNGGRIEVPRTNDPILREQRLHGTPMVLSFLSRGDISLHAAAVEVGSGAVVLAAPSKYGKTTLALAFHRAGFRVLSEDMICCRPTTREAFPGPALLRLRPDVFQQNLPDGLFIVAQRPDRFFVGFEPDRAGSGAPVPILAIVFLREGDSIRSEPADSVTAVKDLWSLSFRIPSDEGRAEAFRHITKLAGGIPAWNVTRPLTMEALEGTVDIVQRLITA